MIPSQLLPFANHIWQSTLFATAAGLLMLLLRKNRAHVRYWLWLSASLKFLVPFSVLVDIGGLLGRHSAAASTTPTLVSAAGLSYAIEQVGEPFSTPVAQVATPHTSVIVPVLIAVWAIGFASLICRWVLRWWRMRASLLTASTLNVPIGLPVRSSPAFGEPGIFGILRPVLLLPDGIADCLTTQEMDAIVTHELCHIRRRDNLTTAIHMAVESLFWFHPLVWWLGARLMDERERACDEEVLRTGGDPHAYAEGILKICELYLASPLACVAGVTGGDLKRRIEAIIGNREVPKLNFGRKAVLAVAALTAVAVPIALGVVNAPFVGAQSRTSQKRVTFDTASVKPAKPPNGVTVSDRKYMMSKGGPSVQMPRNTGGPGSDDPGRIHYPLITLKELLQRAWNYSPPQIECPDWLTSQTVAIDATMPPDTTQEQFRKMLRNLIIDRFGLKYHIDATPADGFTMVVAKNGPKMKESADQTLGILGPGVGATGMGPDGFPILPPRSGSWCVRMGRPGQTQWICQQKTMQDLAHEFGNMNVTDETGLTERYDFKFAWS